MSSWNVQATEKELVAHKIRLVGGASSISKDNGGYGITPSRTGTGAYTLTWDQNPGDFVGFEFALGAATPANVSGHTVVRNVYVAASKSLAVVLYNAGDAAHDLAANEYLDITVYFRN